MHILEHLLIVIVTELESNHPKFKISWSIEFFCKTLTPEMYSFHSKHFFGLVPGNRTYDLCVASAPPPSLKEAASFAQMDGFLCVFEWIYLPLLEPPVNTLSLHLVPGSALHTTAPLSLLTQRLAPTLTRTGNHQLVQTMGRCWQSHFIDTDDKSFIHFIKKKKNKPIPLCQVQ